MENTMTEFHVWQGDRPTADNAVSCPAAPRTVITRPRPSRAGRGRSSLVRDSAGHSRIADHLPRWMLAVLLFAGASSAIAQPIDPALAVGPYTGGGLTLTADDLRRFATEHAAHCAAVAVDNGTATPRGGGIGNVLIVECTGAFGFDTIQGAIDEAADGDVVVVLPNDCDEDGSWYENIDFLGKAIRVQSANPADWEVVEATIIDAGGSNTVVRFVSNETADSVVDGFTITGGYSSSPMIGGGVTCHDSSPTIRRCAIRDNYASPYGGGIYIRTTGRVIVEGCRFNGNEGAFGSAISIPVQGQIEIRQCAFTDQGGQTAINLYQSQLLSPCEPAGPCYLIEDCDFDSNSATTLIRSRHLDLRNSRFTGHSGVCIDGQHISIADCRFEANSSIGMEMIKVTHNAVIERTEFVENATAGRDLIILGPISRMSGCRFEANQSTPTSFLVSIHTADILVEDCAFIDNAIGRGVLSVSGQSSIIVRDCEFRGNTCHGPGSSLYALAYLPGGADIRGCLFESNVATTNGGAVFASRSTIANCRFIGNLSDQYGGAVYATQCDMRSCLMTNNVAMIGGGAFAGTQSTMRGCTVVGNRAKGSTGGVTGAMISNSILYYNRDRDGDGHQAQASQATSAVYSNVQNLQYNFTPGGIPNAEAGNTDVLPRFVDAGEWSDGGTPGDTSDDVFVPGDFRLIRLSPLVDGGDPAFAPAVGETDLDGGPRVVGCRVDLGAYEHPNPPRLPGDFDYDGDVTIADIEDFVRSALGEISVSPCIADLNLDGATNGGDIALMLSLLLDD